MSLGGQFYMSPDTQAPIPHILRFTYYGITAGKDALHVNCNP